MSPRLLHALLVLFAVLASCHRSSEPAWSPGTVYATPRALNARGFLDRRGLIHAHSIYSHDACDNKPVLQDGTRDQVCFEDFRRGLCQSEHDFVMLTDHDNAFSETPYPDNLLYREAKGDQLVIRTTPVANWAACPDGHRSLLIPGIEAGIMPVGLEKHVSDDVMARSKVYTSNQPDAISELKQNGAVALVAHTENWTSDQLINLPLDGFEMFNLHANTLVGAGGALELVLRMDQGQTKGLPHPDVSLLNWVSEDPRYLSTWGTVLASGAKRVTTMGSDCHRNTFPMIATDGERLDSYRRLMIWFSNHLLVRPDADGTWDDRHLKEALKQGRLYGAFEVLGYPVGFDYRAESGGAVHEMGDEVSIAGGVDLVAISPKVENLDSDKPAPKITVRILRAIDGGWDEVAKGVGALHFTPTTPGAYRAEVRMVPNHLKGRLGDYEKMVLGQDFVWIYSNAIYVR